MEILILIIAIIVVFYRKHKGTILKIMKRITLKAIAIALSLIVVMAVLVTELAERFLDRISKEERKLNGLDKTSKAGGSICSLERKTRM